jgi:hypothetical protein
VIADVVSYAIAGIGFINAVGRSFVREFRTSGASFRTFHRLRPTSHEIRSARARVEGVTRLRLLPRPDCQGVEAPPARPFIRGLEANDSKHLTSW